MYVCVSLFCLQANLFQTECKKTFPQIRDYGMFENYRSISNIVDVAEAVANAMTTSGGHLRKEPTVMRPGDLPVVFTTSKDQIVCCHCLPADHICYAQCAACL